MPNRIIKESICASETINQLTWFEECLFYRLIVNCDDFGRLDARPAMLKAKLFPLKERISHKDIESALGKLAAAGCVRLYECDSKPYLLLPTWEVHQSIRAKKSKYPAPETQLQSNECNCNQMNANECKCNQMNANVPVIQSNPNPNPNPNPKENRAAPIRHKHGQYRNVLLSENELAKLREEFPEDYQERIERLSEYIASTGKSYKDFLATIRSWAKREKGGAEHGTVEQPGFIPTHQDNIQF